MADKAQDQEPLRARELSDQIFLASLRARHEGFLHTAEAMEDMQHRLLEVARKGGGSPF